MGEGNIILWENKLFRGKNNLLESRSNPMENKKVLWK